MNLHLVYPAIAMVALTYGMAGFLFLTRVRSVRAGLIPIKYFRTYNEGQTTNLELKASQHFTNLFEMPVLFYAASVFATFLPVRGWVIETAAWVFVLARLAHAFTHVGPNRIFPRMIAFLVGVAASAAMWIAIAAEVAGR